MIKVREHHKEYFNLYLKFYKSWQKPKMKIKYEKGNYSSLVSFTSYESQGKILPTKHPLTLNAVIEGTRYINLMIKLWAEDYNLPFHRENLIKELKKEYAYFPDWVWEAIRNQSKKYAYTARIYDYSKRTKTRLRND